MIKNLIKLANSLDDRGYRKEADDLDSIIRRLASKDFEDYDELFDILKDEKPTLTHTGRPIEEAAPLLELDPIEVEESSYSMRGFPDDESQFQDYEDEDEIAERLDEQMASFIKREIVSNPKVFGGDFELFDLDREELREFSNEVIPDLLSDEFGLDGMFSGDEKTHKIVKSFNSVGKSLEEYIQAQKERGRDDDLVYTIDAISYYLREYLEE
ncbi:MAG: hypothetical protein CBE07_001435 [Pelagibacteraceae bacterium TMED247]|nr:MAG: hypothetical protein CBE07_001435 [Pelagibacteraceae bacterium TMED247]|tara:strand:- start:5712 stop:6350 length:639 start_codon:yes stop_codon:yes gene_type:complete